MSAPQAVQSRIPPQASGAPRRLKREWRRIILCSLAVVGVAIAMTTYVVLQVREERAIDRQFNFEAQQRLRGIDRELGRSMGLLHVVQAFFNASQLVERDELRAFAAPLVGARAGVEFVGWAPRVASAEREAHERQGEQAMRGYHVTQRDANGRLRPAPAAAVYYPLYYVEPAAGGADWLGFDLASVESLRAAIARAEESGQREVVYNAPLLGPGGDPQRVAALTAVYAKAREAPAAAGSRTSKGVVLLVLRIETVVERSLANWADVGIDFHLAACVPGQPERIIYSRPSALRDGEFTPPTPETLAAAPLVCRTSLSLPDSPWAIYAHATPRYRSDMHTWLPLTAAAGCIVGTVLLMLAAGAIIGRTEKIHEEVIQRTAELQRAYEDLQRETEVRRRAEQVLRDSQALYSSLVENLPVHVLRKDLEGRFTFANASFCRLAGRTLEEILGKTDLDLYPAELAEKYRHDDRLVAETGRLYHDIEAKQGDGEMRFVEVMKWPVRDADHRVVGTQAVFWDVTQRWLAEKERERAKQAAEAANRAKSAFLANMSHEIRTPLTAILGLTELVLATPLSAEQREYLTAVHESGESLLLLINDILDFSRIEAGRIDLDRAPFELRESLGDAMRLMAVRAHRKGLELTYRVAGDVPQTVIGDSVRLRQVVVNVVDNAIKFTERGEELLDVTCLRCGDGQTELQFRVADTGIGVPPEKQQLIFAPFEQGESSMCRRFGGTGLGLAISSRLVEAMGGRIWLESQTGVGSAVSFTVQLGTGPFRDAGPACDFDHARVLVVDDHPTSRRVLEEMLSLWEMRPQSADATDAIDRLRAARDAGAPCRVALIDAQMPDLDGFLLAEQILRDPELALPVVMMLTSGDRPGDISRCEQLGVSGYVLKPVKQSDLFDAISVALGIAAAAIHAQEASAPGPCFPRPLAILLAEDSTVNQKLVRGLLARQGHVVTVANNGHEALAALERHSFDLLLLDIQMPHMDGLQVATEWRRRESQAGGHMPIIAMTAHAMAGDRDACLAAGMDAYVSKPIRARVLLETIAAVVSVPAPAPAPEPQLPADAAVAGTVDWAVAKAAVHGDEQLLGDVCRALLEESPRLLAALRQSIAAGSAESLRRAAHTLKSAVGYFGAQEAFDLAYQIERQALTAECQVSAATLTELEQCIERVLAEVARYARSGQENGGQPGSQPS